MKTIQSKKTNLYITDFTKNEVGWTTDFRQAKDYSKDKLAWFKIMVLRRKVMDDTLYFHNYMFLNANVTADVKLSIVDIIKIAWKTFKTEWKKEMEWREQEKEIRKVDSK